MIDPMLPGHDIIRQGLKDLEHCVESQAALLVMIGAPRLRALGIPVPEVEGSHPELQLYTSLAASNPDSAHSRYNALLRTLVSFERALACASR